MPLPIIANVFQCQLVWGNTAAPRPASNILHFKDSVGTQTDADLYADLSASVTAAMWTCVSSNGIINKLNITKLDGSSAGQSFLPVAAAKWTGQGSAEGVLQGAFVVSLKSAQRGPRGRNRVFLPWVGEGQTSNGSIDPTATTNTIAAWAAFVVAMSAAGWDLHAVSAVHNDSHLVTTIGGAPYLKTQRRRARR